MKMGSSVRSVAFIGNYVPRQCGIATFTHAMYASVSSVNPKNDVYVAAVVDENDADAYAPEVRLKFKEQSLADYIKTADRLNRLSPDVVCVQHEYGIYGGTVGGHLNTMLRELEMPVVSTLHTVLESPNDDQRCCLERLVSLSSKVVVMTERGRHFLRQLYGVPAEKIEVIPHGIPELPAESPEAIKRRLGVAGRRLAFTFGLLAPNKGIEHMIKALPRVVAEFPDLTYLVLGATHPNLLRHSGDHYRDALKSLVAELGVEQHVIFSNKFVERGELMEHIAAADLYITPYLNPAQITSGTLAYSFGSGKPVISTPYWHAEELLADGRGVLVPFAAPEALSDAMIDLLRNDAKREAMSAEAYRLGRKMLWAESGRRYLQIFESVLTRPRFRGVSPSLMPSSTVRPAALASPVASREVAL